MTVQFVLEDICSLEDRIYAFNSYTLTLYGGHSSCVKVINAPLGTSSV